MRRIDASADREARIDWERVGCEDRGHDWKIDGVHVCRWDGVCGGGD
jgi:hypothetical protein